MNAGELNRRIAIYEKSITRLDSGAESTSWSLKTNIWAKVLQRKQTESVESEMQVITDQLLFKIRHRTDLDTEMRVKYNNKDYEIISITEIGYRIGTAILTQLVE